MGHFTSITQFADACEGQLMQLGCEQSVDRLLMDSRQLTFALGTAFFALKSTRNDGHLFISELYNKGVRTFVVDQPFKEVLTEANVILVDDVLHALHKLVKFHRAQFQNPVLAVAGSNGKTIVKEWLFQILHSDFQIVRSPKSYNSQIGVPLSLWNLSSLHSLAIIEAGISRKGEMSALQEIINPDWGLLTNVGEAHSEGFENRAEKIQEKVSLFRKSKLLFYHRGQADVNTAIDKLPESVQRVSWAYQTKADLRVNRIEKGQEHTAIHADYLGEKVNIEIPFTDDASIQNAIHCWLVSLYLEIDSEQISKRFSGLQAVDIRLNIQKGIKGSLLIEDYYNSDPESLQIAINHLQHQNPVGKRIVILSAFEQLQYEESRYLKVVHLLDQKEIDLVVCIGDEWQTVLDQFHTPCLWFSEVGSFLKNTQKLPVENAAILLKGARRFRFERISELLKAKVHNTYLEVDLNALVHNLNYFKSRLPKPTQLMVMVKAFSYGSGSIEIAKVLQYNHVGYLGVAYTEEGVELRKAGITLPIMVMHPSEESFDRLVRYQLEPEIFSLSILNSFLRFIEESDAIRFKIHLKLDCGMHRLGFRESELAHIPPILKRDSRIKVASVFSHLAAADMKSEKEFTLGQLATFKRMSGFLEESLSYPFSRHILNTAGILNYPEGLFEMVRLGLGLYGIDPTEKNQRELQAVTCLKTHVSQVQKVNIGRSVGYGRSFIADKAMEIAVLPIGYADGYFRTLSNGKGKVHIKGKHCLVVGKVCMDMCMVDVTGLDVREGEEAELFGKQIPVSELAKWAGTIPYEILAHISNRVPRVYLNAE